MLIKSGYPTGGDLQPELLSQTSRHVQPASFASYARLASFNHRHEVRCELEPLELLQIAAKSIQRIAERRRDHHSFLSPNYPATSDLCPDLEGRRPNW